MKRLHLVLAAIFVVAASACQATPQVDISKAQVVVELRDYSIKPNVASIPAGPVTIGVRNLAGMAHDLTVIKTDLPEDKLPMDGAKVKEDGKVAVTELIGVGRVTSLKLDLAPGNYVLICNVPGHYQLGMHVAFKVV